MTGDDRGETSWVEFAIFALALVLLFALFDVLVFKSLSSLGLAAMLSVGVLGLIGACIDWGRGLILGALLGPIGLVTAAILHSGDQTSRAFEMAKTSSGDGAVPSPPSGPSMQPLASRVYASWGRRVGGYLMRALTFFVIYLPLAIVGAAIGDAGIFIIAAFILAFAAAIRMLIQRGHLGYDVGDAAVGQTLLREESMQPMGSGWSAFGRAFAHVLDALPCYLGFFWPIWDKKRQTFADKVSGTVVVTSQNQAHGAGDLFKNALLFWTPVLKT